MLTHLLTGLAVWTMASVGLGLVVGRVMHGYAVAEPPARPPLLDAEPASYPRAA